MINDEENEHRHLIFLAKMISTNKEVSSPIHLHSQMF